MMENSIQDKRTHAHLVELSLLRGLVSRGTRTLKHLLKKAEKNGENLALDTRIWGEKENFLSVLTKLAQLQMKLIPLEQELLGRSLAKAVPAASSPLAAEEWELLAHAVQTHYAARESAAACALDAVDVDGEEQVKKNAGISESE